MTDKALRRLGRAELIDILYELQKRNDELTEQNQKLQQSLDDRDIHLSEAGSIAEASLRLSGVFEAAQAAADQYLRSIKASSAGMEQQISEAKQQSDALVHAAQQRADDIVRAAEQQAQKLIADAHAQADADWAAFQQKADELIRAHDELRALVVKGRESE